MSRGITRTFCLRSTLPPTPELEGAELECKHYSINPLVQPENEQKDDSAQSPVSRYSLTLTHHPFHVPAPHRCEKSHIRRFLSLHIQIVIEILTWNRNESPPPVVLSGSRSTPRLLNQRRQQQRKPTIAGQHSKPSSGLKLNSRVIVHVARQLPQPLLLHLHLRLHLHLHLPTLFFQRHHTPTTHTNFQSRHPKKRRAKTGKSPKTAAWLHRPKERNMCLLTCATTTLPMARLLRRKSPSNR